MAEFRMPSLGADMDKGTLVEWLVKPGDQVKRGDIVAVVETQKGAIEIEVFESGVIGSFQAQPGTTVPVGTVLAMIEAPGERPSAPAAIPSPPKPEGAAVAPLPAMEEAPSGKISPHARRRAAELGVDLAGVTGSGPGGVVTAEDVEAVRAKKALKPGLDPKELRYAIAQLMARAKREIPHYYVATTIEVGALATWLTERNASRPPPERILPVVPLMKAVALALKSTPELNGLYRENQFQPSEAVHLGIAVALRGGGLIAPAIHNADQMTLDDLMNALRDLVARVRSGRLRNSEMIDPTITITSLGEENAEMVMPVIYPPQVAIVGLGAMVERPWAMDGKIAARPVLTATVAADHRVSDGRLASRFLVGLGNILKEPAKL